MLRGHCADVLSRCCAKVISQAVTARKPLKCPVLRRQAGADLSCRGSIGSLQRVNGPTHGEPGCTIIFRCRPNPLLGRPAIPDGGEEALAISVPAGETRVLKYFQERMPYGLFVPEVR
jgi:hypothetical protein